MAQSVTLESGKIVIPGAYAEYKVEEATGSLAATGIIMLVGEAESGPDFTQEEDLSKNAFGPDQDQDVIAKYGSGPLVDGFRGAVVAANDTNIQGAPNRLILVKTNVGRKAVSSTFTNFDDSNYVDGNGISVPFQAKRFGKDGNLISNIISQAASENLPSTGAFILAVPQAETTVRFRVNGGAEATATLTSGAMPSTMVSAIAAATGVHATGGAKVVLQAGAGLSLALTVVTGRNVRIDATGGTWDNVPVVGSMIVIPADSVISGASNENAGTYAVTAATTTQIFAIKLLDISGAGADITNPVSDTGGAAATIDSHLLNYGTVTVTLDAADPVPGLGKSLEIADDSGAKLSNIAFVASGTSYVTAPWISLSSTTPRVINASQEYKVDVAIGRQLDGVSETVTSGGQVVLTLGYTGTTATATVNKTAKTLVLAVTGGVGASGSPYSINLSDFPTVGDLATYINSLPGFKAAPETTILGNKSPLTLDSGVYGIASTYGARTGRIKNDANTFYNDMATGSGLVELASEPISGLPQPSSLSFLSGGSKGGTTQTQFTQAVDALENVVGNFLVPLFSNDAAVDIANGMTDVTSNYSIDAINAYCRTHCLKMSTLKRRRNRQTIVSKQDTFLNARLAAANMGSFRVAMTFQDVKDSNVTGQIVQFRPWMGAVKAAGMQAAGGYKSICHKYINCTGALQKAGDFKDRNDTNLEDALLAGLLPIKHNETTGGYFWASDQTTYGKDNNFVYNSLQAVYSADILALTVAQRMEAAFVGQSLADVNAGFAMMTLETILADLKAAKIIAASDGALSGFKNAKITIKGPVMKVSFNAFLATCLYFIPIQIMINQIESSAG